MLEYSLIFHQLGGKLYRADYLAYDHNLSLLLPFIQQVVGQFQIDGRKDECFLFCFIVLFAIFHYQTVAAMRLL